MADIQKNVTVNITTTGDLSKVEKLFSHGNSIDVEVSAASVQKIKKSIEGAIDTIPNFDLPTWKGEFKKKFDNEKFQINVIPKFLQSDWQPYFDKLAPFKVKVKASFDEEVDVSPIAGSAAQQIDDILKSIPDSVSKYVKKSTKSLDEIRGGIENVLSTRNIETDLKSVLKIINELPDNVFKRGKLKSNLVEEVSQAAVTAFELQEKLGKEAEVPTVSPSTVPIRPDWKFFTTTYEAEKQDITKALKATLIPIGISNIKETSDALDALKGKVDAFPKSIEISTSVTNTGDIPSIDKLENLNITAISSQITALKKDVENIVVGIDTKQFKEGINDVSKLIDEFISKDSTKHIKFTSNIDDIKKGIESLIGAKNTDDVVQEKQTETIRRRIQSPAPKKTNEIAAGVFKQWVGQNESKDGSLKGLKKQPTHGEGGSAYIPENIFKLITDIKSKEYGEEKFLDDINILGGLEQSELSKPAFERYRKIISDTIRAMSFDETKDYERLISNLGTNIGLDMPNYSRIIGDNEDILSLMEGDKKVLSDALPNLSGEDKSIAEALIKKIDNLIGGSYEEVVQEIQSEESTTSNGIQIPIDIAIPNLDKIKQQIEALNNVDLSILESKFENIKQKATVDFSINTSDAEEQILNLGKSLGSTKRPLSDFITDGQKLDFELLKQKVDKRTTNGQLLADSDLGDFVEHMRLGLTFNASDIKESFGDFNKLKDKVMMDYNKSLESYNNQSKPIVLDVGINDYASNKIHDIINNFNRKSINIRVDLENYAQTLQQIIDFDDTYRKLNTAIKNNPLQIPIWVDDSEYDEFVKDYLLTQHDIKQQPLTIDVSINGLESVKESINSLFEEYKQKSIEINAAFTGDSTVNVTPILNKTIWNKAITDIYTVNVKPKMTKDIWSANINKSYAVAIKPILTMEMWTKNVPTKLPLDVYADTIYIKNPTTKVDIKPTISSIHDFWKDVKQYFADNEIQVKLKFDDIVINAVTGKKKKVKGNSIDEEDLDPSIEMSDKVSKMREDFDTFIKGNHEEGLITESEENEILNLVEIAEKKLAEYINSNDKNPANLRAIEDWYNAAESRISNIIKDIGATGLATINKWADAINSGKFFDDSNPYKKQLLDIANKLKDTEDVDQQKFLSNEFRATFAKAMNEQIKPTSYTDAVVDSFIDKFKARLPQMNEGDDKKNLESYISALESKKGVANNRDDVDRLVTLGNRLYNSWLKSSIETNKTEESVLDIYTYLQNRKNILGSDSQIAKTRSFKNLSELVDVASNITDMDSILKLKSLASKYERDAFKEIIEPQPQKATLQTYRDRVDELLNIISTAGLVNTDSYRNISNAKTQLQNNNISEELAKNIASAAEGEFKKLGKSVISPALTNIEYANKIAALLTNLRNNGKQNTEVYDEIVKRYWGAIGANNTDAEVIFKKALGLYNKEITGDYKPRTTPQDYINDIEKYKMEAIGLGIGGNDLLTLENLANTSKTAGLDIGSLKIIFEQVRRVFSNYIKEDNSVKDGYNDYVNLINQILLSMKTLGLDQTQHYKNIENMLNWLQSKGVGDDSLAKDMYKAAVSAERKAIKEDANPSPVKYHADTTGEHRLLADIAKQQKKGVNSKLYIKMDGLLKDVEARDRKDIQQYRDFMKLYNLNNKAIRDKPSVGASIGAGAVKIGLGAIQKGINTIANLYVGVLNKVKGILMNVIKKTIAIAINPFKNSVKKFGSIIKQAGSKSKALSSLSELMFMPIVLAVEFSLLPVLKKMIPAIKQVIDWVVYSKDKFMLIGKYIGVVTNKVYSMLVGNFVNGLEKFFNKLNEYESWISELYNLDGDTFFDKLSAAGIEIKQVSDNLGTLATVADLVNTELTDFAKNKNNGGIIMKFVTEMELAIGRSINSATEAISNTVHTILTDPQLGEDVTTFINNTLSHLFKNVELTTEMAVTFFEKLSEGIKEYLNNEKNSTQIQNIANNVVGIIERVMDIATGQVIPKLFETGALQKAAVATAPVWGQILGVSLLSSVGGSILTGVGKFVGTKIKNKSISNGIMNGNQKTSLWEKIKGLFSNNNKVTTKSGALTTGQNAQVNNIVKNLGSTTSKTSTTFSKYFSAGGKLAKFLGPIGEAITVGTMGYGLVKSSQYDSSLENRDYMLVGDYLKGLVEATSGVAQYSYTEESLNEIAKYTGLTSDELKQLTNSELKALTDEMYSDAWKNGWGKSWNEVVLDEEELLKFRNLLKYGAVGTIDVDNSDVIESNKAASQTLLTLLSGRGIAIDSNTRKIWENTTGYVRDTYEELMKVATTTSDGITIIDPDISAIRGILEEMNVDKLKETSETGATNIADKPEAIYHDGSDGLPTWEDLATEYAKKYLENPNQTLILPEGLSYNKLMEKVNELTNPNYGVDQVFESKKFSLDEREKILDEILAQNYGANWVAVEKYAEKMGHLASYYSSFLTEGNAEKLLTQRAAETGYKSWLETIDLNPSVPEKTYTNPINLGSGYGADSDVIKLIQDIKDGQNVNLGINELQYLVSHSSGDYNKLMRGIVSDFDTQLSRYESINLNSLSVDLKNLLYRYNLTDLSELINPTKSLPDSPTIESFSPSISIYMDKDNKVTDSTVKYDNGLGTIRALNISGGI